MPIFHEENMIDTEFQKHLSCLFIR